VSRKKISSLLPGFAPTGSVRAGWLKDRAGHVLYDCPKRLGVLLCQHFGSPIACAEGLSRREFLAGAAVNSRCCVPWDGAHRSISEHRQTFQIVDAHIHLF